MSTDDTLVDTSSLWHGGGQWLLYGLGLLLEVTIEVTSLYPLPWDEGTGFTSGGCVDIVCGGERRIHLAMLHDDDGTPDHFDVLAPIESASAEDATMTDTQPAAEAARAEAQRDVVANDAAGSAALEGDEEGSVARALVAHSLAEAASAADCGEEEPWCWVPAAATLPSASALEGVSAAETAPAGWREWALGLVQTGLRPPAVVESE